MRPDDQISADNLMTQPYTDIESFRSVEPALLCAMERPLETHIFAITGTRYHKASTVANLIRGAIKSKIAFDWPSKRTSQEFREWKDAVIIRTNRFTNTIEIVPRHVPSQVVNHVELEDGRNLVIDKPLLLDEFKFYINQLLLGNLRGPIRFTEPMKEHLAHIETIPVPELGRKLTQDGHLLIW